MKLFLRTGLFIIVFCFSIGLALLGCDESKKNDNNSLMLMLLKAAGPKIYIFDGGTHTGDLKTAGAGVDGREGADNLCKTAQTASYSFLNGKTIKAFINVSTSDQIKDVVPVDVQSRPVYGVLTDETETLLKDSWTELWGKTGINATLLTATGITGPWWNASYADGTSYDSNSSCNEWEHGAGPTPPPAGRAGSNNSVIDTWIEDPSYSVCSQTYHVLCVAY